MVIFFQQYLQKLFPSVFNEANINLAAIILSAFIGGCFIFLRLYRSKQKMIAAANFVKEVSESNVDSVSYKDGWTKMEVTFKKIKRNDENDSDDSILKRA